MDLFDKFLEVISKFEKENVDYVIIGGFAVVLHGLPRLTQDIDIFIRPTEENIDKLRRALKEVFTDSSIDEITLQELNRYPVIRYGTPEGFNIDLIANIGDAFYFDDVAYEKRHIEGNIVKIATPESLLKMKENTLREVDQLDIKFLREKLKRKSQNND
jgi:hypothetical protein